jgi:hypothetical protein
MDLTDQSSRTGILLRAVLHRAGARDQPMDFRDYSLVGGREVEHILPRFDGHLRLLVIASCNSSFFNVGRRR